MQQQLALIEEAQTLLTRQLGASVVMAALMRHHGATAEEAERATDHAVYLLKLEREG